MKGLAFRVLGTVDLPQDVRDEFLQVGFESHQNQKQFGRDGRKFSRVKHTIVLSFLLIHRERFVVDNFSHEEKHALSKWIATKGEKADFWTSL